MMFEWVAFEVIALLCGLFPGEDYAVVEVPMLLYLTFPH